MVYVVAALAILVFMIAFVKLGIVDVAKGAITTSREVTRTLRDGTLHDDHKEQALQKASLSLLGNFVSITLRGVVAIALSVLVVVAADYAGLAGRSDVVALLSAWETIVVATVVITAGWLLWIRR